MNISDAGFQLETPIEFPADEVHLWRVELAAVGKAEDRWKEILSADERARAARFHFPRDRQYFMAARAVLRMILAGYAAFDPKKLVFRDSDKDKPFLSGGQTGSDIEFNVSHSGNVALLAFARGRDLGIDVEKVREDFEHKTIARRFFSEQEQCP